MCLRPTCEPTFYSAAVFELKDGATVFRIRVQKSKFNSIGSLEKFTVSLNHLTGEGNNAKRVFGKF